jgi:uncharacterized membrane protein HdeD (DUF308 family)
MEKRRVLGITLVVVGVALFASGFLSQNCPPAGPGGPLYGLLQPVNALNCTRPAITGAILFWVPGVACLVLGVVLLRRARTR